jgi:RHS repeat-associated protein
MASGSMIRVGIAAAVAGALLCGTMAPASAQESGGGGPTPVVGGFGLGDRLEGLIDAQTGGFAFTLQVAGLELSWQSSGVGLNRFGLGDGWAIAGLSQLDVDGGVRVFPASGDVYEADASAPSGLHGYTLGDLAFSQEPGVLPARADGLAGEREYAYRLSELGGVETYFDALGDPVAHVDPHGLRRDWIWGDGHRIERVIAETGVVTELDWADASRLEVTTQSGGSANTSGASEHTVVAGVIELVDHRVAAVVDAVAARTAVTYGALGQVIRLSDASGAETAIAWQSLDDGRTVVERVAVTEPETGRELSARSWAPVTAGPTGWPAHGTSPTVDSGSGAGYVTSLSDGATRVESTYTASHLLTHRTVSLTRANGAEVVESHVFEYPATAPGADPHRLPPQAGRLTASAVTSHDATGGERTVGEQYTVDELGRVTERTAADGTTTTTVFDTTVPAGKAAPIGLPLLERTTTADGLVTETHHELNGARTDVVATETYAGHSGDTELVRTARSEFDVAADGFVSAERVFPQGGAGTPVVTERTRALDVPRGTLTIDELAAAGTGVAASTTTVTDLVHAQPIATTDAVGRESRTAYDGIGRPIETVDGAGNMTETEYLTAQQHGINATTTTSPDRVARTEERDVLGRVKRVTDNLDRGVPVDGHERVVETRDHRDALTVAVTDAWGSTTVTTHDVFGRTVETVAPTGLIEVTEYDGVAGTTTKGLTETGDLADAELVSTESTDVRGEVVAASGRRADGLPVPAAARTLDGFGRETSVTDGLATTSVEFDEFGNPVTTSVAASGAADAPLVVGAREFDDFGESTQKTLIEGDHSRRGSAVERDVLGRTVAEIDQDEAVTRHDYTVDGLVERTTTPEGAVTANTYDPDTRLLIESVVTAPNRPTVQTAYRNDPVTGRLLEAYDPADLEATRVAYEYDGWGNVLSVTYPDDARVTNEYDEHGRKVSTTDVADRTTTFGYDEAGLLDSAVQLDEDEREIARVEYAHDALGRVTTLDRGNGVTTAITYTSASEIESEITAGADGAALSERRYTYTVSGDVATRVDAVHESGAASPDVTTTAYEYDELRRLTRSTIHDGDTVEASPSNRTDYQLNASGDIERETVTSRPDSPEASSTTRDFSYAPTGALVSVTTTGPDGVATTATQTYDAAGSLTRAVDGTQYRYDAANRTIAEVATDGTVIDTAYWATGERRSLTTLDPGTGSPESTGFYWADGTLVNETHARDGQTAQPVSYLLTAAGRHARSVPDAAGAIATSYSTHDRHGNVTELTGADGSLTESYRYSDYGITSDVGITEELASGAPADGEPMLRVGDATYQPFRFAGEYTTPTSARTQHLAIREYDADTMRFTGIDPERLHNRYGFGDLNPIMKVDPSGRTPTFDSTINWVFTAVGFVALVVGVASAGAGLAMMAPFLSTQAVAANALLITAAGLAEAATVAAAATQIADELSPDFTLTDEQREILTITQIAGAAAGAALGVGAAVALRASYKVAGARAQKMVGDLDIELSEYLRARRAGDKDLSSHPVLSGYRTSVSKGGGAKYTNATKRFNDALTDTENIWTKTAPQQRGFFANRKLLKVYKTNVETMESYAAGLKRGVIASIGNAPITAGTKNTLDSYLFALSDYSVNTYPTLAKLLSSGL